jgi:glycine/D-amino acid oxidase-like deaminating enzyme
MFRYSQDAVDMVVKLVSDEGIDCDLTPSAHLLCATTRAQAARLARQSRVFTELCLPVSLLTQADLTRRLGHGDYFCGLEYQPVVLVNPLKLTLGLADAAAAVGVRLTEQSQVTGLDVERGGVRVQVGGESRVRARMVVVATDGYTPPSLPHGRRVVPVRTHVLATRPLTAGERAGLGWSGSEAVIDQRTFFSYYRFDAGGRLLFGGGPVSVPSAGPHASERIWRRLERELAAVFPSLTGVPAEHRWSGLTSATIDELPVVGEVPGQPGVFFAGAWRGHGHALSIANGAWLAHRLAHGDTDTMLPWHRSHTRNPRLGPLQETVVRGYVSAFDAADRVGALAERLRPAAARPAADQPAEVRA